MSKAAFTLMTQGEFAFKLVSDVEATEITKFPEVVLPSGVNETIEARELVTIPVFYSVTT